MRVLALADCHCPPRGINDDPDDPSHVGFEGLRAWVDHHRPRHILHGHTHPVAGLARTRYGDARVHWISGARVVLLDCRWESAAFSACVNGSATERLTAAR